MVLVWRDLGEMGPRVCPPYGGRGWHPPYGGLALSGGQEGGTPERPRRCNPPQSGVRRTRERPGSAVRRTRSASGSLREGIAKGDLRDEKGGGGTRSVQDRASRRRATGREEGDRRKYLTLTEFSCIIVMEKARYMGTCRKGCMGAATRMEEAG